MTFKEAIDQRQFDKALEMIQNGEDLLKSQFQIKLSDAFSTIIRNNAYEVLTALVEEEHIELDVFEYDSFRDTIFEALAMHATNTPEAQDFLADFIPQVENLDDSLEDKTWLSMALEQGMDPALVQTMIENGCDVNYIDAKGNTLLHIAAAANAMKVSADKCKVYLELLLEHGLDVNRKTELGDAVIHKMMQHNEVENTLMLIEHGADPNVPNSQGKTVYHQLIIDQNNMALAKQMADIFPPDFEAETGTSTDLFFDYLNGYFADAQQLSFFAEHGANPDKVHKDVYGTELTAWDVVMKKDFAFFEAFMDAFEPDVNQQDNQGNTLLHKVCAFDINFDQNKAKDTYRKTKKLLKMGADASIRNTEDKTAADLAGQDNLKEKTVAILLKQ